MPSWGILLVFPFPLSPVLGISHLPVTATTWLSASLLHRAPKAAQWFDLPGTMGCPEDWLFTCRLLKEKQMDKLLTSAFPAVGASQPASALCGRIWTQLSVPTQVWAGRGIQRVPGCLGWLCVQSWDSIQISSLFQTICKKGQKRVNNIRNAFPVEPLHWLHGAFICLAAFAGAVGAWHLFSCKCVKFSEQPREG